MPPAPAPPAPLLRRRARGEAAAAAADAQDEEPRATAGGSGSSGAQSGRKTLVRAHRSEGANYENDDNKNSNNNFSLREISADEHEDKVADDDDDDVGGGGDREEQDDARPRGPNPFSTGQVLQKSACENAHQNAPLSMAEASARMRRYHGSGRSSQSDLGIAQEHHSVIFSADSDPDESSATGYESSLQLGSPSSRASYESGTTIFSPKTPKTPQGYLGFEIPSKMQLRRSSSGSEIPEYPGTTSIVATRPSASSPQPVRPQQRMPVPHAPAEGPPRAMDLYHLTRAPVPGGHGARRRMMRSPHEQRNKTVSVLPEHGMTDQENLQRMSNVLSEAPQPSARPGPRPHRVNHERSKSELDLSQIHGRPIGGARVTGLRTGRSSRHHSTAITPVHETVEIEPLELAKNLSGSPGYVGGPSPVARQTRLESHYRPAGRRRDNIAARDRRHTDSTLPFPRQSTLSPEQPGRRRPYLNNRPGGPRSSHIGLYYAPRSPSPPNAACPVPPSTSSPQLPRRNSVTSQTGTVCSGASRPAFKNFDLSYVSIVPEAFGSGSFGTIHRALDRRSGIQYAVKRLRPDVNADAKRQFAEEVALMQRLAHENIVQYVATRVLEQEDTYEIFLEYVPGGSLSALIKEFKALSVDLTCRYARQMLCGIRYLHKMNVIHRDIKGANVLVTLDGTCKLADFGTSRALNEMGAADRDETLKHIRGTVVWMAPEVVKETKYHFPADIWSFAATVLEMSSGERPWPKLTDPVHAIFTIATTKKGPPIPSHVPEEVRALLKDCFRYDAAKRPDADALLAHHFFCNMDSV